MEEGKDPALMGALQHSQIRTKSDNITCPRECDDTISETIRPLLCRMYIAADILNLGTETRYAALVYLHRYCHGVYNRTGKVERPNQWVAAACLLLATKSQEEPRRLRDVINLAHVVLVDSSSLDWSDLEITMGNEPPLLDEKYWEAKKKVVETEQSVLRWLGFETFVPHPHRAVFLLTRHVNFSASQQYELLQEAFRRLNNTLFHSSALRHDTLPLATAAIELVRRQDSQVYDRAFQEGWWKRYGVSDDSHKKALGDLEKARAALRGAGPP